MRILLSGTSNAVLVRGLKVPLRKDSRVTAFANHSYGSSGTLALADHLRHVDFRQFDYCVLDYCINEEDLIAQGASSVAVAMNNLLAVIDAASCAGCQPLVLILASSRHQDAPQYFGDAIRTELIPRGVPIFDALAFARSMTAESGLGFDDLFLDPRHMKREIGRAIAHALLDHMSATIRLPARLFRSQLTYDPLHFVPYTAFGLAGHAEQVRRKSAFLKRTCLELRPGGRIAVAAPAPGEITGICFDMSRSVGTLKAEGDDRICWDRRPGDSFFRVDRGLTLTTTPLRHPVALDSGHRCVLHYDFDGTTTQGQPDAALTVSGLTVRLTGQPRPVHLLVREAAPTPLEDWIVPDRRADLATALMRPDVS